MTNKKQECKQTNDFCLHSEKDVNKLDDYAELKKAIIGLLKRLLNYETPFG